MTSKNILFDILSVFLHLCKGTNLLNRYTLFLFFIKIRLNNYLFKKYTNIDNKISIFGQDLMFSNFNSFLYSFKEIFIFENYSFRSLNDTPTIIDVGSNIGLSVIYFKLLNPNANIIAFEPDPDNYFFLKQNTYQMSNVKLFQFALSDNVGERLFYRNLSSGNLQGSFVKNDFTNDKINVNTALLSSFIDTDIYVDLLKIDVEGSENEVIRELIYTKKILKIKQILVEYHTDISYSSDSNLDQFISMIENAGFKCVFKKKDIINVQFQTQDIILKFISI